MTDFRERYKRVGFGREDVDVNRVLRSQQREESRHEQRSVHFSHRRDLHDTDDEDDDSFLAPEPVSAQDESQKVELQQQSSGGLQNMATDVTDIEVAVQKRLLELEKWKEERNRKKMKEKKKLRPAFKVGVVHHRIYSPPLTKNPAPLPLTKLCKSREVQEEHQPPKRVTRATEKRLAAKAVTNKQRREDLRSKKKVLINDTNEQKALLAPNDYQFRAPVGLTPLPVFGRMAVKDSKTNVNSDNTFNVTSSISEAGQNFSDLSDSVFLSTTKSSGTSEVKARRSNLSKFNAHTYDSTSAVINKTLSDYTNNSSIDPMSEKWSAHDEEIKVELSPPKLIKSLATKKKSIKKCISKPPDVQPMVVDDSQPASQDQKNNDDVNDGFAVNSIDEVTNRKISYGIRRSKKILANQIASPTKLEDVSFAQTNQNISSIVKNVDSKTKSENITLDTSNCKIVNKVIEELVVDNSFVSESQIINNLNIIDSKLKTTTLDSPMPLLNPVKSSTKRRSMKSFKSISEDQVTNEKECNTSCNPEKEQFISVIDNTTVSKINRLESVGKKKSARYTKPTSEEQAANTFTDQLSLDSTLPKQTRKSTVNRRNSKKVLHDENIPVVSPTNETLISNDEEITMSRKSEFDVQNKHLLDITLSDLNKLESLKKRRVKIKKLIPTITIQDESLIKFSPRQSLRLQKEKEKQQAIIMEVNSTTKTPESKTVDQTLIKFDPLITEVKENLNESTSSEPTKQRSLNDSQDFRLNLTLPDELPSEKPPAFYSPFVVMSRGKSNIRKEVQKRRFSHHLNTEDVPTKDTIMQSLNISVEEEERTAQYYKYILNQEIERLKKRCDSWNVVKEAESTPEDICYLIQAAVGHTQLLINKKFERFRRLVLDCETGKGEMLVTCKDLQGFWEMMYMEIKDVDNRFNKLDELKGNNWVEKEIEDKTEKPKKKPAAVKKPAVKKVAAKSSSIRAHIMAARKKMENKEGETDVNMEIYVQEPSYNKSREKTKTEKQKDKHSVRNSHRFSNQKMLNQMPTSSSRKSQTLGGSPLIMIKVSQMCKTPDVQLDGSIMYINSDQTPAKSILKDKTKEDLGGSVAKSKNKVLFKTQHMEVQEYISNEEDFRSSEEFNETENKAVGKKLDFEADSFSASPDKDEKDQVELRHQLFLGEDGVVCEKFLPVTPKASILKRKNSERSTKNTKSDNKIQESNASTSSTPRPQRQDLQKSDIEFEDSPSQADRFDCTNSEKILSTPRTRRTSKRSMADAGFDSENPSMAAKSPKVSKKTPKITKILDSANTSDKIENTITPRLRRTKSLIIVESKKSEKQSDVKTPRSSLRRTNSRIKADSNKNLDKAWTPSSKRESLKVK